MSIFEKAVRAKLRFKSERGIIMTEDLFDLNLPSLDNMAIKLKKQLKESKEESFLDDISAEDTRTKLAFDVVLSVLTTKKEEKNSRVEASEKKVKLQELLALKAEKQKDARKNLSIEELDKEIAELNK